MKSLQPRKDTKQRERQWSAAVFATFGRTCWLHKRDDPKSKYPATDAAHIVKRSRMGSALAFGSKDGPVEPHLGRPLCRYHHERQELGIMVYDRFSYADVLEAVSIHNQYARSPLPLPAREDYP